MDEIRKYVMPLFRRSGDERSFAGTAFCIDNWLVTAGHVIDEPRTYFVRNGVDYHPLEFERWTPRQLAASDRLEFDIALYPLPGLHSPLTLAPADAVRNQALELICWQWRGNGVKQVATDCLHTGDADIDGYFRMSTVERVTHGSSGCPIFADGLVYGIMTMGRDRFESKDGFARSAPEHRHLMQRFEENTCWVFKTSHIRRFF